MSIQINSDSVKITINNKFYPMNIVNKAIIDFRALCTVEKQGNILILKPKSDQDKQELAGEFMNYLLELIQNT